MTVEFLHSNPLGDPPHAGIDLGAGDDMTVVSLYSGELGFIEHFRFINSPSLLHWPARFGRRAPARSARARKRALHAAGMRHGRVRIARKILPPFVSVGELSRLANPFRNRCAETMGAVDQPEFRRTSGSSICAACGKEYRRHPNSEHLDWSGYPFLNRLCSGDLVKL